MRQWQRIAHAIDLSVTGKLARAFNYLEAHGLMFCTHFGTDNAIAIARQHWNARKRKARKALR